MLPFSIIIGIVAGALIILAGQKSKRARSKKKPSIYDWLTEADRFSSRDTQASECSTLLGNSSSLIKEVSPEDVEKAVF